MTHRPLLRVFAHGGVVAPADLARVLDASEAAGNGYVHFSSRQDILFPVAGTGVRAAVTVLREAGLPFAPTSLERLHDPWARRNVVSSYAAVNVTETTWWLTEDVYEYTLANFREQPRTAVHLVDPAQSLVPPFGGQVHFVASTREHYWHLYLRDTSRAGGVTRLPGLLHGEDLPRVARSLEEVLLADPGASVSLAMENVPAGLAVDDDRATEAPRLAEGRLPYYEGFNAISGGRLWLGLYWRNNRFDIPFLRAACELCRDTGIGKISLTPWKSFLIKGIRSRDRGRWEELLGAFGINTRHSSLELNWHIPVLDEEALELKNELVRELTTRDISTSGLTFTIRSTPDVAAFTTVLIERETPVSPGGATYRIRHARDFDAAPKEYVTFAEHLGPTAIPSSLIDLSRLYWRQGSSAEAAPGPPADAEAPRAAAAVGHQCPTCLTVYDERYGDAHAGVDPGVPFDTLPSDYTCPVCSAPREAFAQVAYG